MDERRSYLAWAVSSTLHAALLVLLVGFFSAPKFEDNPESIPVETVSLSDLNRIMNGEKDAKPAPEPTPKPEPAATSPSPPEPPPDLRTAEEPPPAPPPRPEPPPPPKEEAKPPPPKPAPPSPPKSVENAPEPPVRPKEPEKPPKEKEPEKPKPDPIAKALEREKSEPQPEKPKPARFDPNAIAKLIGEAKPSAAATASNAGKAAPQGLPHHDAPRMSLSVASALDAWLQDSYYNCWTTPPVTPEGDVYVAEIKVVLNPDGSLSARPVLLNPPTDPAWRAYAESAMRAVKKCDPLHVPPEYAPFFEEWKVETIHFDPRQNQG